ncbi:SCO family protein [Marinoscillum furvescens]|uniref:Protein SCO1/2 n=1 Tax=Marinoscillum furvescens DSM 4134 TaxID=1122208 RepID=A0A3D9L3Q2_MARFU|nr:SCO family protein [Marinoscillum furvescens]RED99430.1 protein SCO1/2 [Marinoscillum furvescens DSM 4134]
MKNLVKIYSLLLLLIAMGACDQVKSDYELPILGRKEYVDKVVDGKTVKDTIYHTIAEFEFVNQDSSIVNNTTFANKVYVADFFFTSCPTICPVMKKQMLRVYEKYNDNPNFAILSHSIDPEHDTVALLNDFAQRLGVTSDTWHFVTGDKDEIYDIGEKSYMVVANEDPNAPGGFIHSGAFILVDQKGRIRGVYDGTVPEQVDILINDIARLTKKPDANT